MARNQVLISRRTLLSVSAAVVGASAMASCSDLGGGGSRRPLVPKSFDTPLTIPALAEGTLSEGRRTFELTAQAGTHDMGGSSATPTWGFNGPHLGPTLRARAGEDVSVRFTNDLSEETTVHWHGMHLPAAMDGGPHQMVEPGATWEPEWAIHQQPATLWYHPHPHGETERHVYNGLAGMFIIDPSDGPDSRLPHSYGVDDIPVIVQDKRLDDDNELDLDNDGLEIGLLGDRVLANGTWGGHWVASRERVRLRLLNGSTARTYNFGFSDDRAFDVIGTDGGLLASAWRTTRVQLSPGERAEVVVAVRPKDRVRLTSYEPDLGAVVMSRVWGGEDIFDVLELRGAAVLDASPAVPTVLSQIEPLDPAAAAMTRQFVLEGREINGQKMDMDRIDDVVTLDTTEVWEVRSRNPFPHNFHVHDVQFQVVSVDGEDPPPMLQGWKDTVYLAPQVTYRLVMRFTDYADPSMPYMYHCHLLLHEDDGMMGQFVVVAEGDSAGELDSDHSSH